MNGPARQMVLHLDSRYENVALAGASVRGIGELLFDEETVRQLELAVVEGINNAIEHAYRERPGAEVCVELRMDEAQLTVVITDRGASMDPALLERGTTALDFDAGDVASLPEGGMGLALMLMAMDEVRYATEAGENRLTLVKRRTSEDGSRAETVSGPDTTQTGTGTSTNPAKTNGDTGGEGS